MVMSTEVSLADLTKPILPETASGSVKKQSFTEGYLQRHR